MSKDKKDNTKHKHMDGMQLLDMLKSVLPALMEFISSNDNKTLNMPLMPLKNLKDEDLDHEDPMVSSFNKDMGGCKGLTVIELDPIMGAEKLAHTIENMEKVHYASKLVNLRKAFEVIKDFSFQNTGEKQIKALELLSKLEEQSQSDSEKYAFNKAKKAVLAGTEDQIDAAAYRLQKVFASNVKAPNLRVAFYENPRAQDEEPYQLCPKARHQVGHAVPMPISSCRDNCIDSRVTKDGKVSCAYQDWLKTAADNHINVINRLDEVHPETNAENRLNLKDGERFNERSMAIDHMTFEARMQEKLKNIKQSKKTKTENDNIEAKLDNAKLLTGHQGLVGEGNMENRLRNPVIASKACIDPEEEISFGAQLEAKRNKALFVDEPIQARLDEASEPNLGRHGEPTERIQDVNVKKAWNLSKNTKLEFESEDTLGTQVSTRHETDEMSDQTLEELLADAEHYYDEDEMEALLLTLEESLSKSHKGY